MDDLARQSGNTVSSLDAELTPDLRRARATECRERVWVTPCRRESDVSGAGGEEGTDVGGGGAGAVRPGAFFDSADGGEEAGVDVGEGGDPFDVG